MSLNARASILDGWTWKQQSAKYAEMLGTLLDVRKRKPLRRPEDPLLEPSALGL